MTDGVFLHSIQDSEDQRGEIKMEQHGKLRIPTSTKSSKKRARKREESEQERDKRSRARKSEQKALKTSPTHVTTHLWSFRKKGASMYRVKYVKNAKVSAESNRKRKNTDKTG